MKTSTKFPVLVLVALLAGASSAAAAPARPAKMSQAETDSVLKVIEKDRTETLEWLRESPTSYLAAIARRDFGERTSMVVGSAEDADVRVNDPEMKPHHLRVTVVGDSFRVEALDPGATFQVAGRDTTVATVDPSRIDVGRFNLRLSHQNFPAIIVFDPQSPLYAHYKGLDWFPPDLSYRYVLPLTRNPKPDTLVIMSTRGNRRMGVRVGWFDFMVGDKACRLEATHLFEPGWGEDDFGIYFRDATSGNETYELGRYVGAEKLPDGRYVLDFNMAYNPACAVSDYYNCPIPPKANFLDVAIKAGEKDVHYH